ncbi:NAD-dependent epimerase/dehydratase family protein [Hymenobacter properus]|uniref:NAD-dependent epimerase/dehydratase family protein n=1 Tax=Hymenobacter properus TaxID=2791026 RepID=A0A931BPW2_9BACT|nr:NAD-dependent epimerase/dehydratase family protein [Hymenobacter properus]MBF9143440.1 NAD-dependent epimerase/dehydratase family protein [Hymenobacter properus]MBR7722253.1 NAD-dependent epimerase/dehydratase family protein [Microvirga sp. SRT04]
MKVVLFGAQGFAGRNVANELRQHQIEVIESSLRDGLDLRDADAVTAFLRVHQPTHIVNCAAHVGSLNYVTEKAATVVADNSRMILGMYEAIATACPQALVINPIANCAYPAKADLFREDEWWDGHLHRSVLSYGATRRLLWATAECFQMQYGIRSINLLTPNMYGPYDSTDPNKAHALNALISKFVKAEKIAQPELPIWGTGVAIREWLYAPDFARIVRAVLEQPDRSGLETPLNVAQNDGLSVKELVDIIQSKFDYQGRVVWDHTKPDGAPKKVMDDTRFRQVFPSFEFTDFEQGIANTIAYYESVFPY